MSEARYDEVDCPRRTPWDHADHAERIGPGLWFVSTPGHGGLWLSPQRQADFKAKFPAFVPFTGTAEWLEEDCDWAVGVLAFPDAFQPHQVEIARATVLVYPTNYFDAVKAVLEPTRREVVCEAVMFDESDCGGVFDGRQVVSDADPGL